MVLNVKETAVIPTASVIILFYASRTDAEEAKTSSPFSPKINTA
jgi:hypothetical protein